MISGRNGGPTVANGVPSAGVLMPKPQVGRAKSLIDSIFCVPYTSTAISTKLERASPLGKDDMYSLNGAHVESSPGAKVIIGLVRTGPRLPH